MSTPASAANSETSWLGPGIPRSLLPSWSGAPSPGLLLSLLWPMLSLLVDVEASALAVEAKPARQHTLSKLGVLDGDRLAQLASRNP